MRLIHEIITIPGLISGLYGRRGRDRGLRLYYHAPAQSPASGISLASRLLEPIEISARGGWR